jgi:uncharacterized protein involved in response to NO
MEMMEPKRSWLRKQSSLFTFGAGIVGILALFVFAAIALGYTPQRVVGYIQRHAPQMLYQVQREIQFGFTPKQIVPKSGIAR